MCYEQNSRIRVYICTLIRKEFSLPSIQLLKYTQVLLPLQLKINDWLVSVQFYHSFHVRMQCFIYHIDQGLRSGGGIADVLESASGDPNEFLRLCFDITFFFFVVVILLAIIQGGVKGQNQGLMGMTEG